MSNTCLLLDREMNSVSKHEDQTKSCTSGRSRLCSGWFFSLILILTATLITLPNTWAATLQWDSDGSLPVSGGSGTWNSVGPWYNGSTYQNWVSGSDADFGGSAGSVEFSASQVAGNVNFATGGYTINFGTTFNNALTLTSLTGNTSTTTFAGRTATGTAFASFFLNGDISFDGTLADGGGVTHWNIFGPGKMTLASGFSYTASGGLGVISGSARFASTSLPTNMSLRGGASIELATADLTRNFTFNGTGIRLGGSSVSSPASFDAIGADRTITMSNTSDVLWQDFTSGGGSNNVMAPFELGLGTVLSEGKVTLAATSRDINLNGGTRTVRTENGTAAVDAEITLTLVGTGGAGNLVKVGGGVLALSGSNTYDGTTTASAGTLLVNGTTSGQGNFTVASGAILGGTGTIGLAGGNSVTVQSGGTITGGASSGTLTIDSDLVLNSGALIDWEYDGSGEDLVSITGLLTLPLTATINAIDLGGTLSDLPVVLTAGALSGATDLSGWIITGLPGYTAAINGNSVVLVVPVPEPSSLLLAFVGLVGLARYQRKQRK